MKATDILMSEHRCIEQVLSALEGMAALATKERRLDPDHARQAIDFIRNFADKFHHAKEEDLLFAEMEAHGFPREGGPIAVMLREHDLGRDLVARMAEASAAVVSGEQGALGGFSGYATQFAGLLRAHIQKEDHILYPLADDMLGGESEDQLLGAFAHAEAACGGPAARARFAAIAQELQAIYAAHAPACGPGVMTGLGCGHAC